MEKYSNEEIVLSTANTYSYTRGEVCHLLVLIVMYLYIVKKSVREYIEKYMVPQSTDTRASGQLSKTTCIISVFLDVSVVQ